FEATPTRGSPIRLAAPVARTQRIRTSLVVATSILLVASAVIAWRASRARETARPVLAVGRIRDLVAPDSAAVSAVLSEMLATSLGRIPELRVVANSRMVE